MKNSKRTPRTLKGAVLIMVMTVMFVLIFLLAGTIAVVYSAHNRAMVKYEESQAYYTARSVLDTYLETFLKDNDNKTGDNGTTGVDYYYFDETGGTVQLKNDVKAKQGRALELDIYGLKVSVAPKGANASLPDSSYPFDGNETFWNAAPNRGNDQYLHDWVKQYILDLMLGDFSLSPGQTLEQFRAQQATNNLTAYEAARVLAMKSINSDISYYEHPGVADPKSIDTNSSFKNYYKQFCVSESDDTLYYRIPTGTGGLQGFGDAAGGGSYGKVADVFPDGSTYAVIKVQLLERTFNLSKDGADFKFKFDGGNREKDHVKISVTAEIMLDGVPTTTSVVYANEYIQKPSSNKAIVSLSDVKGADSIVAFGGATSMASGVGFTCTNDPKTTGNVYLRSGINFGSTNPKIALTSSNYFYSDGTIEIAGASIDSSLIDSGATFFSKKMAVNQRPLGSTGHEVNVICGEFEYTDLSSDKKVTGRVFTDNVNTTAFPMQAWDSEEPTGMHSGKTIVQGDIYTNYITFKERDIQIDWDNSDPSNPIATFNVDINPPNAWNPNPSPRDDNSSFKNLASGNITIAKGIKVKMASGGPELTADVGGQVNYNGIDYNVNIVIGGPMAGNTTIDATKEVKVSNVVRDADSDGTPDPDSTSATDPKQDFEFDTASKTRKFKLPAALIGKTGSDANVFELDTLEKMYSDYFKSAAVPDNGTNKYYGESFNYYGDFNDEASSPYFEGASGSTLHMSEFDSPTSSLSTDFMKFLNEHVVQPQDRNNKVDNTGLSAPSFVTTLAAQTTTDPEIQSVINSAGGKTFGGVISSDCMIPAREDMVGDSWYNSVGNYLFVIDTRSGPVDIQMGNGDGGTFGGNFAVLGTNKCTILMPASSPSTFVFGNGNAEFSLYDSRIGRNPSSLNLGTAANPTVPPAIDIVCSKNATSLSYGQKAIGAVQGYVYAPYTKFDLSGGTNGININITADTHNMGQTAIAVIGSVFCSGYSGSQKPGVAFIDPNQVTSPPGDKVFAWSDVYYQRGV
ncbi:MAG: hypothetical protein K2K57_11415 [Oscillospiraceae bacterium]|nr:hypothetical protein [Oscillospiraceae bacterium]